MTKKVIFTDRSVRSVDLLLKAINKYPVLSTAEEYDLWERMQKGSRAARERLINCNLRYVVTMAKKYLWSGIALEDLINTGALGLTLAADKFDATRGYHFLSYAVWWIDSELKKAVTEQWPYEQMASLDAPLDPFNDDCTATLLDLLPNSAVKAPDWNLTYNSEMTEVKKRVEDKFFDVAASIFEDAIELKDKGLTLYDVARKYQVSEDQVRHLLKQITNELKSDFSSPSYRLAA